MILLKKRTDWSWNKAKGLKQRETKLCQVGHSLSLGIYKMNWLVVGGGVVGGEGQPVINFKDEGEKEVRAGVSNDKITLCETNIMY